MQQLDSAPQVLTEHGATPLVMYRKDRVRFVAGEDRLKSFRLSEATATRRIIASCCNSPVLSDFKHGHWYSLFGTLWPDGTRPPLEMRTMASDLPKDVVLPDDVPNANKLSLKFFGRLFGAWVAMGFRTPKSPETEEIEI